MPPPGPYPGAEVTEMSGLLDRYEALCAAAREGRVRYAVVCGGEREDGFMSHREAEEAGLGRHPDRHFRVEPYVLPAAA